MPQSVDKEKKAKTVANWLLGEFSRMLNVTNIEVKDAKVEPVHLVEMLDLIDKGTLSTKMAKEVFEEMFHSGKGALQVVQEKGLVQISGASELEEIISQVLAANAAAVADFKKGKEQSLKFLVGQVMKATKGQANPQMLNELLRKKLAGN
jgi:aspartyl-tRNA(Asn)/glutamyl-tRNA(Gln) amidotransferase subunit B